jgi:alkanesulfonate monooxygenase SsuD/methylene tetrahydromethanopterin reductase-like flavin-dependent oxidoreductase (luciferase family)
MAADMRFGLFGGAQAAGTRPDAPMGQGLHDYVDFAVEADRLGYRSAFVVEHHFSGWTQVSATLELLTWVAARTERLRVGTAVIVLPWHNPVLLAEQAATLDLLCGGRLDLGIGKGYRYNEFRGFCIAQDESEERFDEALEVLLRAWTSSEPFSHDGRFWRFEQVRVEPPPRQLPHPPIWMAAGSDESIAKVAQRGFNLLLDQFAPPELLAGRIAQFKRHVEARGERFDPMRVAVARDVYVARDRADRASALERNARARQRTIEVARTPGRRGGSHVLQYADAPDGNAGSALYGSVEEIAAKLEQLHAAGVRYVLASMGGMSRESLRRFAREIGPHFDATFAHG